MLTADISVFVLVDVLLLCSILVSALWYY